jgi:uncharacterized protein YjbJ (UPF0337 family)
MRFEDEVKGKGKQVAGKVKESVGRLAGDRDLEEKGKRERFEGSVQQTAGKVRRRVGEALENLGDKIASKG